MAPQSNRRRGRLPVWLALLILSLALAVVIASQLYWRELRDSVGQLHGAMAAARGQQQQMIERLREAEAALAEVRMPSSQVAERLAASGPALADAALPERLARAASDVERVAAALAAQRPTLPAPDREQVRAELETLARDALHLPTMRHLPPPGVPDPGLVLRGRDLQRLLRDAAAAAALDDLPLVGRQVTAARQLLGYYRQEPRALGIAARLERLRARLDAADRANDQRLEQLAAELRALARQLPATQSGRER